MNKRLIEFKRKEKYWNELKKSIPINEFLKEIDEKYADIQDQREKSRKISLSKSAQVVTSTLLYFARKIWIWNFHRTEQV